MTNPTDRDRDAACAAVNIAAAAKEPPAAGSQAEAIDVLKKLNAQGDAELTKARADLDTARMSAIEAKEITRELRLTLAGVEACGHPRKALWHVVRIENKETVVFCRVCGLGGHIWNNDETIAWSKPYRPAALLAAAKRGGD